MIILIILLTLLILVPLIFLVILPLTCKWPFKFGNNEKFKKHSKANPLEKTCDVIIPCIPTHIKFLKRLMKDISRQTRSPDRVIISLSQVSRKEAKKLEDSLKKIYGKISIISTEKPQKSWDNRDRGAIYSNADVYCFLDADDRVHPQRIEAVMDKFERHDVLAILCEYSADPLYLDRVYKRNSFSFITGEKIYKDEGKKFKIHIKQLDVSINYSTGNISIDSDLWWSVGGQTKITLGNQEILNNNGRGEDIIFVRTIISKLKDKNKFIIMKNPLLVYISSESRKEDHWKTDPNIKKNKTLPEVKILIENRINREPLKRIFCFWTGTNKMSSQRKKCLQTLKKTELPVILITIDNLNNFILPDHPLHEGFSYLSDTIKSDYLRVYFMHFHGGGYSDIKFTTKSWIPAYNKLIQSTNMWCIGYQELRGSFKTDLFGDWDNNKHRSIGNGMYICKPNTPLTTDWYNNTYKKMDKILPTLKKYPSKHPQQIKTKEYPFPLIWGELGGIIRDPLIAKYSKHILQGLPPGDFNKKYR